jgi:hypothetical protein
MYQEYKAPMKLHVDKYQKWKIPIYIVNKWEGNLRSYYGKIKGVDGHALNKKVRKATSEIIVGEAHKEGQLEYF